MLRIGITGGIGSGKSTICRIFQTLGIPVYDADSRAKALMLETVIRQPLVNAFGESVYASDGSLNRAELSGMVFNSPEKLEKLNSIVHPVVFKDYEDWVEERYEFPYTIKEAALLFESGSFKSLDYVITVSAPKELRIRRVVERDGSLRTQVLQRMKNQLSEKERLERADFVIYNDDKKLVLPQVLELHKKFTSPPPPLPQRGE
jgi:dephospho-CoA kinase